MDHDDKQHSGGVSGSAWLTGVLVALVLYVLSPGPVLKISMTVFGTVPSKLERVLDVAYAPLEAAYDLFGPVKRFYDWYFHLFGLQ